jgi:anthranilate/para-aminobenzoate synthase component II
VDNGGNATVDKIKVVILDMGSSIFDWFMLWVLRVCDEALGVGNYAFKVIKIEDFSAEKDIADFDVGNTLVFMSGGSKVEVHESSRGDRSGYYNQIEELFTLSKYKNLRVFGSCLPLQIMIYAKTKVLPKSFDKQVRGFAAERIPKYGLAMRQIGFIGIDTVNIDDRIYPAVRNHSYYYCDILGSDIKVIATSYRGVENMITVGSTDGDRKICWQFHPEHILSGRNGVQFGIQMLRKAGIK